MAFISQKDKEQEALYNKQIEDYQAAANKYNDYVKAYQDELDTYNKRVEEWNAGPRTKDFGYKEPVWGGYEAPAQLTFTQEDLDKFQADAQARAQKNQANRAAAYEVAQNPDAYNLAGFSFAEGGEVFGGSGVFGALAAKVAEQAGVDTSKLTGLFALGKTAEPATQAPEVFGGSGMFAPLASRAMEQAGLDTSKLTGMFSPTAATTPANPSPLTSDQGMFNMFLPALKQQIADQAGVDVSKLDGTTLFNLQDRLDELTKQKEEEAQAVSSKTPEWALGRPGGANVVYSNLRSQGYADGGEVSAPLTNEQWIAEYNALNRYEEDPNAYEDGPDLTEGLAAAPEFKGVYLPGTTGLPGKAEPYSGTYLPGTTILPGTTPLPVDPEAKKIFDMVDKKEPETPTPQAPVEPVKPVETALKEEAAPTTDQAPVEPDAPAKTLLERLYPQADTEKALSTGSTNINNFLDSFSDETGLKTEKDYPTDQLDVMRGLARNALSKKTVKKGQSGIGVDYKDYPKTKAGADPGELVKSSEEREKEGGLFGIADSKDPVVQVATSIGGATLFREGDDIYLYDEYDFVKTALNREGDAYNWLRGISGVMDSLGMINKYPSLIKLGSKEDVLGVDSEQADAILAKSGIKGLPKEKVEYIKSYQLRGLSD